MMNALGLLVTVCVYRKLIIFPQYTPKYKKTQSHSRDRERIIDILFLVY